MRRRTLALLLLLPLVLVGGLWLGPRLVDWDAWRERLADAATTRLGRAVALDGPIELTLLPSPMVRAAGVAIGAPGDEIRATARLLRLRLDLPALLAGRIEPREIALVGAELTLPWPPGPLLALRPPPWLTALDARVEDGRVRLGETVLEGVSARLVSAGAAQVLEASGGFAWAGRAARFEAVLGRPGWDGIAPLDLTLSLPDFVGQARGVLVPGGGFEGRMEVSGADLSALLPVPALAFRAAGRLVASAELVAADDLALDLGGAPARGALAVRLSPAPRVDLSLIAPRLELDAWVAALRAAAAEATRPGAARPWPVAIDLAAEAGAFAGVPLRRLRGAAALAEGRLTLTDMSVLLPGETEVEFAGATAGARLEIGARFAGPDLQAALLALGLPVGGVEPTLLRRGEGRLRLVLEEAQAAVPDFAATLEGWRVSGAGTLRHGARPALGLGVSFDRLDLGRWAPGGFDTAALARALAGLDVNLRLAAEEARLGPAVLERAALDAAAEGGRFVLRRLSGRLAETDIALAGTLVPGAQPRLQDLTVEADGPSARGLFRLVPGRWPDGASLAGLPVALRLTGGGTAEALALRGSADLGELRAEAQGTLDLLARRGTASLTLRHPGAPRLLAGAFGPGAGGWVGDGSFSLVASLAAGPGTLAAESFELVAGTLRAGGQLALAAGDRPRLTGRIAAERLPLPLPALRGTDPLPLDALAGLDAELALEAGRIELGGAATLGNATAELRLEGGRLALDRLRAGLAGGTLEGALALELANGGAPLASAELRLEGATLAGPLFGLPFDITAGRGEAAAVLAARGHTPRGLLGSLTGSWRASLRDGVVTGFDLGAAVAASGLPDATVGEAAARRALSGGATAFDRLELEGTAEAGQLRVATGRIATEAGAIATLSGEADLPRGAVDLRLGVRAAVPEAPDLGLRATGPAAAPRILPETAAWARWRAEGG